ncbi:MULTISPECIES: AraC family transcriptional regulator [unclassified Variovorax]|uniref:AraC family transcriptional regulator n=1 Tax=unclassified Variovorax TaxID=663243 RepID=UPI00076C3835|nr:MULTISPECIES: AraC family transcriptional regulator [unclassified Variovorax]KWT68565.1 Transcriptional regulator, AraC family [Variovorax sp. WDL1]PNG46683.1 RCS-specific HTH-type transcriptional activator RclR [Variovorax sp. B2]PNG48666.1 RCS-specific HTH-type transcriptional activator RclR [Variovorax sp. B4]VTV14471.1 Urease operon transcriptional activator [Variovorax sp. WDL1]
MDLLSRVLSLVPVTGSLDVRCHFGAPWRLEQVQAGVHEIAYHVLLSGAATVEDAHGPPQQLEAGDILLFPRRSPHRLHDGSGRKARPARHVQTPFLTVVENTGKRDVAEVLCGRFLLGASPSGLIRDYLPHRLVVHSAAGKSPSASRLSRLVALMREEALEEAPGSASLVSHLSAALFGLTLRLAGEAPETPKGLLALAQSPRLQPAIDAIFDSPEKPWNLPALAALCHMSRATFVRHFESAIGRSAADVLTEIRMTHASRKLQHSHDPVGAIGEAVGYQSEAAFQRAFKRHLGTTPARWRANSAET